MKKIIVKLNDRSYPIYIGKNILSNKSLLGNIKSEKFAVVTNKKIKSLHLSKINNSSIKNNQIILNDGEKYKNQESIDKIYNYLLKNKYSRDSCIIAFGGGVIGDITGYASATYQRGINFVQIHSRPSVRNSAGRVAQLHFFIKIRSVQIHTKSGV